MRPEQALEKMRSRIEALMASAGAPMYKVESRVVEGQRLYEKAMAKLALFEKLALINEFDLSNLTELELAALALRCTESEWKLLRNPQRSEAFQAKIETAETARRELLRDLDYVETRFTPEGLARALGDVRKGSSREDLLQDVEVLWTLTKKHASHLATINFDTAKAEESSSLAAELGRLLNPDNKETQRAKQLRNSAATLLESMMSEVRAAATFLFRHDPDTLADFRDQGR